MDDMNLMDALGLAALGYEFARPDPILTSSVDDILDPYGIYRSQGIDPYGNPLPGGKPTPDVSLKGRVPTSAPGKVGAKLAAFKEGFDAVADPRVAKQTKALGNLIGTNVQGPAAKGVSKMGIQRLAGKALGSKAGQALLKYAPVVGSALSIGDLILGDESLANKGMDATLMTAGGALGSVVPVIGTSLGITGGKLLSDGIQFVVGGGKTPEQQRLEEALAQLNGGVI